MKGLRKILRVSLTAKKTNEWVFNKAGVNRELLDTVNRVYSYATQRVTELLTFVDLSQTVQCPKPRSN